MSSTILNSMSKIGYKFKFLIFFHCVLQCKFVDWLLSFEPCQRPTASEILNSKLLEKFRSLHPPKLSNRDRTISSSSSGSISGGLAFD